ncbi:FixH family protein [Sulfurimonas sp. HSL-3221]|uniref:FixH family protein n=1 Tax=Sulfurimonadaceae TaxID=2771471 RepID=UPI001E40AABE|nr:FixH family protein [Sulfurimonas sp. HSL-3221]UFS62711.1 FixH family protein [Sulfurimonas sp. HSL-3221]
MSSNPGRKWPWIVVGGILCVVGLSYWTVQKALDNPVQLSDLDMQDYRHFEHDANAIIRNKIAFDKKYELTYVTETFKADGAVVKFKLLTRDGTPVDDANVTLRLTRPGTHAYDMTVALGTVEGGIYTFETVTLPKEGRWDILAQVNIGDDKRYLNLKADTRYPNVFEY